VIELHAGKSSNSQRVSIVLEECGLPYRVRTYSLMDGEHRTPAFAALNPAGMVPVIVDDDGPGGSPLTLTQSGAIAVYLAEKAGRFLMVGNSLKSDILPVVKIGARAVHIPAVISWSHEHADPTPAARRRFYERRSMRQLERFIERIGGESPS